MTKTELFPHQVRQQQLLGLLLVLCSSHITVSDAAAAVLKQCGPCMYNPARKAAAHTAVPALPAALC